MPSSTWRNIETFVEIVTQSNADSLFDIGVGNGKWGFLFREYSDVWNGRITNEQWKSVVDGVEVFGSYIGPHQKAVYSRILIGDARKVINEVGEYDLINAADVLEHMPKSDAVALIRTAQSKCRTAMTVSIPIGPGWIRESFNENPYEAHASEWEVEDFKALGFHLYNTRPAPDGKRQVGYFVYSCRPLAMSALERM